MSFELASLLVTLFVLAGIGTPIGYSILLASVVYLGLSGLDVALAGEKILQGFYGSAILLAVPLFIVAANIMNAGSITDRLLNFCVAIVGRFKGGMGHVNVVASLIFSGMSGSAVADAAGIGKIIISMMTRSGKYSRGYAAAITAASATIGPIIPPSIPMVLYALVSNASIGSLFLAGILPGLIMGAVLMAMNGYLAHKRGFEVEETVPLKELPRVTANAFPALLMPVILLYGIYGGVTTPTEAAAVAAFYALMLAALFYRSLSFKALYQVFVDSARSSAAVGIVIGGAFILNFIVITEQIPQSISGALEGAEINNAKKKLADAATALCHGKVASIAARQTAETTFEQGGQGDKLPTFEIERARLDEGIPAFQLFREVELARSGGEARRLIKGGGAKVNDVALPSEVHVVTSNDLNSDGVIKLSAGKKRHALVNVI